MLKHNLRGCQQETFGQQAVRGQETRAQPGRVTQVEVTPETLGLSVEGILTRQQRRAQKRARRAG